MGQARGSLRLILSLVALLPVSGAALSQTSLTAVQAYREFIAPSQVSSQAIVGLAVIPSAAEQKQDLLHVYFKEAHDGSVKLELTTADGVLRGEGEFRGKVAANTWAPLSISTSRDAQARSERERSGPETLAVSVRLAPSGKILPVYWGGHPPPRESALLRLYANSRRADLFVRLGPDGPVVRCQPISGMTPVKFDKICDLPTAKLAGKVTVMRRDGFETESFELVIPW